MSFLRRSCAVNEAKIELRMGTFEWNFKLYSKIYTLSNTLIADSELRFHSKYNCSRTYIHVVVN